MAAGKMLLIFPLQNKTTHNTGFAKCRLQNIG
jgi:hypothetical protein